jgi:long-chain-fatty-acid--CoA ligase ACSBG
VDDSEQLNKILKIKHKLPHLKAVVKILSPFDEEGLSNADGFYTWKELEEMNVDEIESDYEQRLKGVLPTDCCSLCYTSGTTGEGKLKINLIIEDFNLWSEKEILLNQ